ncbi:ABC transporter ATP-binding protein [Actinoplanes auranticolor]|uniref:ABC transporter n=1 Tax=Actinoplanes auranticolor TaxID=47988 RepID=A0A919SRJ4_9ACTN|nr:ABC transporter ATP-binding protein [Actinoplanes auranticolor]GIM77730.1 ABC transporter [Actinoplanes auranticolor]
MNVSGTGARGDAPAIVVDGLTRRYGNLLALDQVSFTVEAGQTVALLGPNGAGKTTAVEILEGYRSRDSGSVSVLGFDPAYGGRSYRERIGIVLQSAGFEEEFTVGELLRLQVSLYPRRYDPDELAELVGLTDRRRTRVKTLSGGQRRRLDLALGLAGRPDLLFLDEPTTGFDPAARHHAWDLIARLRALGTTILLTTHYIEEAERLADRVAVLRAGRLVAWGRPSDLQERCGLPSRLSFRLPTGFTLERLPRMSGTVSVRDAQVVVHTYQALSDTRLLTHWAAAHHLELPALTLTPPVLEDAYLSLTGEPADDDR